MPISLNDIYTETRRLTRTNSTTLANADCLLLSNDTYLDMMRALAREGVQVTGVIAYTNLVASQNNYAMPDDCFMIVRMEVNYDDPTDYRKWRKMSPEDLPNLPVVWQSFIQTNLKDDSVFDVFGGQFYVAPTPTALATAGLRLWYIKRNASFTGTTPSTEYPPYPFQLYWQAFTFGNAYKYFLPLSETEAAKYLASYNEKVKEMVDITSSESAEPVKTQGVDYTNHGWQ